MKKILLLITIITAGLYAQDLSGKKFCLDPGHGFIPGQASDCGDAETKRFESYQNHIVVPKLKEFLQSAGATVITTRNDYDSLGACITLSQREAVANNAGGVNWFQSVHHNAFNGTVNYTLVLYEQLNNSDCPNGNLEWPGQTDVMGQYQATRVHNALGTSDAYYRGDECFLGFNLGVLNSLTMPGTLSEGSFWDYPDEIPRLQNPDYLKTEAEALYHAFLQYYGQPMPANGSLVGIITNSATNKPASNVTVVFDGSTYAVDNRGNGFYRFEDIAPGTYDISVYSAYEIIASSVTITGGAINHKNLTVYDPTEVGNVKLLGILNSSPNSITLFWEQPAGTADSILIFLSEDGVNWAPDPSYAVAGSKTSHTITGLTENNNYTVKLKAKNQFFSSAELSKGYTANTRTSEKSALIVDGFNRFGGSASNPIKQHSYSAFYGAALDSAGIKYSSVHNTMITSSSQLSGYDYVIWFVGDESTEDETFSHTEQGYVEDYLKGGGKLFVTGSEIAWDLDNKGDATDIAFYNNYLKADYYADNHSSGTNTVDGVSGTFYSSVSGVSFGQIYPEDYPDVISPINGSFAVLKYNALENAGIAFEGIFPNGAVEGKLVYIAFPVETISDISARTTLIKEAINFFDAPVGIYDEDNGVPDKFALNVYPNPFNPATNISVSLPEAGKYKIVVYDLLGREVKMVSDGNLDAGLHKFNLDMSRYASGTYIVSVRSAENFTNKKIILLK